MIALSRLPDLNSCSCLTRYSGCWPWMIGVTFFGLLLTPVFYVLIRRYVERSEARKAAKHLTLESQQ